MKRKLVILNVALVALAAAAGWQLRARWMEGKRQEQRVLRQPAKPAEQPTASPIRPPQPATAVAYGEVAQKLLFSPDRNPTVVEDVAPPKPVPPFPVFYGMMSLGGGPTLFFSEKPGAPNHAYSAGEKVGEFMLAAVEGDEVVLEWDGQKFRKKLQDLRPPSAAEPPQSAAPALLPASAAVQVQNVRSSQDTAPDTDTTSELKACTAGDTSPAGTIRGGYRKVVSIGPVGQSCRWERVK